MRTSLSVSILVAAALISCSRQAPDPKYDVNCPIRSMKVTASKGELGHVLSFDRAGHLTLAKYFNEDGSYRFRRDYQYDSLGRIEETVLVNADNQTEERWEYRYDGDFVEDCTVSGMNNEHVHRWLHTNDGEHIVRTVYCSEDVPFYIISKEYDGDVCHETTCDADNGDTLSVAENCRLTKDKVLYIKSASMDLSVVYNEQGLPVSAHNTSLDSECQILWESSLADTPDRFFTYEFDKRGNWTVRKEYSHPDSIEVAVIRREFKY